MNKIEFPRRDVDGSPYDQNEFEKWYLEELKKDDIISRLKNNVNASSREEKELLKHLIEYLPDIILMSPLRMRYYTMVISKRFKSILVDSTHRKEESSEFGKQILDAFNYAKYRESFLVKLAKKLNIKTCTYCNMNYTLYAEESRKGVRKNIIVKKFARLQFDHFYDKMTFPMLSMSVYNLIPCCPSCNQGKHTNPLSHVFHPYANDIHSLFSFEVSYPIPEYVGEDVPDHVDVKLNWDDSISANDRKQYEDRFHLCAMYSRHGDVVKETFDQAYAYPYYSNPHNFPFLINMDEKYRERFIFGNYMRSEDIDKRPLAKFKQDLRNQAEGIDRNKKK